MSKHRLEALTEGVYAIAMTIMVLDLKIPHATVTSSDRLWAMLTAQSGTFISYAVSFALLGLFWIIHNKQMHHVRAVDTIFLWLNLLSLACISLVPYTTSLQRVDLQDRVSQALFAVNLFVLGMANASAWFYASRKADILDSSLNEAVVRHVFRMNLLVPAASVVAFAVSFRAPHLSGYCYLLIIPFKRIFNRRPASNGR